MHVGSGTDYVGSAVNIEQRWREHRSCLRRGTHHSRYLQSAWNKYGEAAFGFVVLEWDVPLGDLLAHEQAWLDTSDFRYNVCRVAGNCLGVKHTPETRAKWSAARKGKPKSSEWRSAIGTANIGKHSMLRGQRIQKCVDCEAIISLASVRCLPCSHRNPNWRAKISAARMGQLPTAESRAKQSAARKGQSPTAMTRAKLSAWQKGRAKTWLTALWQDPGYRAVQAKGRQRFLRAITSCPQGHPYDAANTRRRQNGGRDCRACDRERTAHKRSIARAARG